LWAGWVVLAVAVTGCAGAGTSGGPGQPSSEIVVLAAASLTEAFTQIAADFEAAHPGTDVTLGFGGSSTLGPQIVAGAPADVFAAASPDTMRLVVEAGAVSGAPAVFARNRLQIAVPAGNPADVGGLADLADPDLLVALCAPEVPCGAAAETALAAAGVQARPDTLEQDVRAVLTKIELGEVDAGLVYRTDVLAAGAAVEGVRLPVAHDTVSDYLIAALADADDPDLAVAFVDCVLSEQGQETLADAGFERP